MSKNIYVSGSLILLAHGRQCEITWDMVYGLLSAKLDKIKLEQDVMKKDIKDLMTSTTASNQQAISFEKRLTEVANISQQMFSFQERLDNMDGHVKDLAAAEVGRRTHLLRRELEQEKAATKENVQSDINVLMSATDQFRVKIFDDQQEMKSTIAELLSRTQYATNTHLNEARVQISNLEQELADTIDDTIIVVGRIETIEKTQAAMKEAQIVNVEQKVAATQNNTHNLQSRVLSRERKQADLNAKTNTIESQVDTTRGQIVERIETLEKTQSDMKGAANKTQAHIVTVEQNVAAQIATVEQKVVATQSNTQTLQSRVQILEGTQGDLKSKTRTIESQVNTTLGQISRVQQILGTFAGFSAFLYSDKRHYAKSTVIIFDQVIYNHGNFYNSRTGIFTVPVKGVYVFTFYIEGHCNFNDTHIGAHVHVMVNSAWKSEAAVQDLGKYLSSGNTAVVNVNFGDKVYVQTSHSFERNQFGAFRTRFSGALLHVN